MFIYVYMIS